MPTLQGYVRRASPSWQLEQKQVKAVRWPTTKTTQTSEIVELENLWKNLARNFPSMASNLNPGVFRILGPRKQWAGHVDTHLHLDPLTISTEIVPSICTVHNTVNQFTQRIKPLLSEPFQSRTQARTIRDNTYTRQPLAVPSLNGSVEEYPCCSMRSSTAASRFAMSNCEQTRPRKLKGVQCLRSWKTVLMS